MKGHAEAIKLLLTVSGINVNHANVSLYLLSSIVEGGGEGDLPHLIPHSNPRNDDLSLPIHNMYPNAMNKNPKVCMFLFVIVYFHLTKVLPIYTLSR